MCEFCHKHGEGKKWYLEAKNYSEDLLSDLRRRKFIAEFMSSPGHLSEEVNSLERLDRAPAFVQAVIKPYIKNRQKKIHFGQVVPIEDIERIFGFVNAIARFACICREITYSTEQRYCYGVSMVPHGSKFGEIIRQIDAAYLTGPNRVGIERLTKEQAITSIREHEKEGLCHSVWTFITPFIGGICNCDRADCMAMRATVTYRMPIMFRAEYVGDVNPEACNGCRQCMRVCQFGAITYGIANKKVNIDQRRCFGCGICRSVCTKNAIVLKERASVPVAAKLW